MRDVGIWIGRSWAIATLDDGHGFDPEWIDAALAVDVSIDGRSRQASELFRRFGYAPVWARSTNLLHVFRGTGHPLILLQDSPSARSLTAAVQTWPRLQRSQCPADLQRYVAGEALRCLAAMLDDEKGVSVTACRSVTIALGGHTWIEQNDSLAEAVREIFGVEPAFMWLPTALSAFAFSDSVLRGELTGGDAVSVSVRMGESPSAATVTVSIGYGSIHSLVSAATAPGKQRAEVGSGHEESGSDAAAASGAALWGRLRSTLGLHHQDLADVSFRFRGGGPDAPSWALSPGHPGASVYARCMAVESNVRGAVPAALVVHLPWATEHPVLRELVLGRDELRQRWDFRMSIVLEMTTGASGVLHLIPPTGRASISTTFQLLPLRGDDTRAPSGPELPDLSLLEEYFVPRAALEDYRWRADADGVAMYPMPGWEVVPGRNVGGLEIRFLEFTDRARTLEVTCRRGARESIMRTVVHPRKDVLGLVEHSFRLDTSLLAGDLGSTISWQARRESAKGRSRRGGEEKPPLDLRGQVQLTDASYGLSATLEWKRGRDEVLYPFAIGHPVGAEGPTRISPAGLRDAGKDDSILASIPPTGEVRLRNSGSHALEVQLEPDAGLRVARKRLLLEPGTPEVVIRAERRRTGDPSNAAALLDTGLHCRVWPVLHGRQIGPSTTITVPVEGVEIAATPRPLPPEKVEWALRSWPGDSPWILRLQVEGAGGGVALLRKRGDRADPIQAQVLPGSGDAAATRWAEIVVSASPERLLHWFPGPLSDLVGELELVVQVATTRGVSVPIPFHAKFLGAFVDAREIKARSVGGQAVEVVVATLITPEVSMPLGGWVEWDSPGAPFGVRVSVEPRPVGGSERTGVRGRFPAELLAANRDGLQDQVVSLTPVRPTGWEDGAWEGRWILSDSQGKALDQIRIELECVGVQPRIDLGLGDVAPGERRLHLALSIINTNPVSPLCVARIRLDVAWKVLGVTVLRREMRRGLRKAQQESDTADIAPSGQRGWAVSLPLRGGWWAVLVYRFVRRLVIATEVHSVSDPERGAGAIWKRRFKLKASQATTVRHRPVLGRGPGPGRPSS